MTVIHFQRLPHISHHSIERVFATVRSEFAGIDVKLHVCPFPSRGVFGRLCNMIDAAMRQGDVNHITGDVHYLTLLLRKSRTVLTVHDCGSSILRLRGLRRFLFQWLWLKLPVWRCSVVSVISEHTKREVLKYTSCPQDKIRVIPDPVGKEFQPFPKAFNVDKPRILQVGTGENKNLVRLAAALSGIRCRLDIIGPHSPDAKIALEHAGIEYEWATGLSDAQVAAKYREADILTFCSTYEGFGLPIIEAQAVGRPVVTSNIEPMAEVGGGAVCLVDPFDSDSLRHGILRVIEEPGYREELIRKGLKNVKKYSAEEIGRLYLGLYREVISSRPDFAREGSVIQDSIAQGRQ